MHAITHQSLNRRIVKFDYDPSKNDQSEKEKRPHVSPQTRVHLTQNELTFRSKHEDVSLYLIVYWKSNRFSLINPAGQRCSGIRLNFMLLEPFTRIKQPSGR